MEVRQAKIILAYITATLCITTSSGQAWGELSQAVKSIVHPKSEPTLPMVQIAFKQKGLPHSFAEMMEYHPHMVKLALEAGIQPKGPDGNFSPKSLRQYLITRGNEWIRNQSNKLAVNGTFNSSMNKFHQLPATQVRYDTAGMPPQLQVQLPSQLQYPLQQPVNTQQRFQSAPTQPTSSLPPQIQHRLMEMATRNHQEFQRRVHDARAEMMDAIAESPLLAYTFFQGPNRMMQGLEEMPGVGGMSGFGGMPGFGGMADIDGIAGVGGMAGFGGLPGFGEMPGFGGMPSVGGMPGIGGMPVVDGMADIGGPGGLMGGMPGFPGLQNPLTDPMLPLSLLDNPGELLGDMYPQQSGQRGSQNPLNPLNLPPWMAYRLDMEPIQPPPAP